MTTTEIAAGAEFGEGGRYQLERLLGTGGMASVWLATDARLERRVAVKILSDVLALDAEFVARFEREARLAGGLSHPHLVHIFDFGVQGTRPYLVMEYVAGGTLAQRLRGPWANRWDAVALSRELLDAVAYVHQAGVVHRDIKPANILIGADGRTRLTDFGIAQPSDATGITAAGQVVGTQRYIAPEILRGRPATERSDLYSCGVLLAECAGPQTPPQLRRLVDVLTAEDPRERPASAARASAILDTQSAEDHRELADTQFWPAGELADTRAWPAPDAEIRAGALPTPVRTPDAAPRVTPTVQRPAFARNRSRGRAASVGAGALALVTGIVLFGGGSADARDPLVVPPPGETLTKQLDRLEHAIDRARR